MNSPSKERIAESASFFRYALPRPRLGISHDSIESYFQAVGKSDVPTEFSLAVLLSSNISDYQTNQNCSSISILLGKKLRGFGKGFFNCFGGKLERSLDEHKHPARGAVREVKEETGMNIPLSAMEEGYIGTLNFTFADWDVNKAMKVHLFCVVLSFSPYEDVKNSTHATIHSENSTKIIMHPDEIRGCDEIEPVWYKNVYDIPLHEMFADDSIWLVMLLKHYDDIFKSEYDQPMQLESHPVIQNLNQRKLMFDAWFHFQSGGAETNLILHHFIKLNQLGGKSNLPNDPILPESKYTIEKQLFHALHLNHIHSPSIKEFKENWAMANAVRRYMGEQRMEYVIDVAGGHGALVSGKDGIRQVWSPFWSAVKDDHKQSRTKTLRYRHECLRTGLRKELETILFDVRNPPLPSNVLVTACHACQHLTDETMQIAAEYGVNVACMPCCQKDHDGWWKQTAKQMKLSIGATMDLLTAGKMLAWETGSKAGVQYQVKMKLIDEKISPLQNRIILCKTLERQDEFEDAKKNLAHTKLTKAYHRAHQHASVNDVTETVQEGQNDVSPNTCGRGNDYDRNNNAGFFTSLLTGFCVGIAFSLLLNSKSER